MSGLDKIIEHIESSASENAAGILQKASAQAADIIERGREETAAREAEIRKQGQADVAAATKRIESEAAMAEKRFLLKGKQDAVNNVLEKALEELKNLPDEEYFETILKMVRKYAAGKEGNIKFNSRDLGRMPEGFIADINEAAGTGSGIKLSDAAADICGGFVLDFGDIEDNCSFDALLEESREQLQDKISQILFE